ncbi:MAG TPA: methyltransferase domain-containing protein [Devosiaceae bacterium]|jgi:SAM-dependent methyltransferase|nr:methyltransferase domain-containing protein [Devosiaceae bacterium]
MNTIPFEPRRFRSTAAYYARYRVPYPATLIAAVATRLNLKPGDRVLDLGCGPGQLGLAFAALGMDATGVDPEPEMIEAARAAAREARLAFNVVEGSSYGLGPHLGRFRLVVMGRSFHWMDRQATLEALDRLIEPEGAVGLFHDRRIWASHDWHQLVEAGAETFSPGRTETRHFRRSPDWLPHEAVLLGSAFSAVETHGRVFRQELTIDDIIGRTYSMSVTSPEALGERMDDFEAHLRAALRSANPGGRFAEIVSAEAILAFRPG